MIFVGGAVIRCVMWGGKWVDLATVILVDRLVAKCRLLFFGKKVVTVFSSSSEVVMVGAVYGELVDHAIENVKL